MVALYLTCDSCHAVLEYEEVMDGDGTCDACHIASLLPTDEECEACDTDPSPTWEVSEEEMNAIAKELHARVVRGELDAEFVYGEVGYYRAHEQGEE